MKQAAWTAAAILVAWCLPAHAHQLDEYLQATRILVAADRVRVEMGLTPGVAVLPRVLALIDRDGDGRASSAEIDAYVRRMLHDVVVSVDGSDAPLTVTRVESPAWDELRGGTGTIRIDATAAMRSMSGGRHTIRVVNAHAPEISVYLVNALVPADPAIAIGGQRRDVLQHGIELDVDVARPQTTVLWSVMLGGAFAVLAIFRVAPRVWGVPGAWDAKRRPAPGAGQCAGR
jgi:hypothetical protein